MDREKITIALIIVLSIVIIGLLAIYYGEIPLTGDAKRAHPIKRHCVPSPEICDAIDNNCNKLIDENLPIKCSSDSNCGKHGWTGDAYCSADGNVHRNWVDYKCNNPGKCSSTCSSQNVDKIYVSCSYGCLNGVCLLPQCNDGTDNDGDTYIDHPSDLGCTSSLDNDELGTVQCDDGIDNDGDGLTDYPKDSGCSGGISDDSEFNIYCGDGTCNGNETCTTCSTDCGACTALSLESPYGVNDWNFINDSMDAMQEAGIKWIRIGVNWQSVEAVQGQYNWNQGANNNIDFYISQAQKYGMKVSVVPFNAPAWAKIATNEVWRDSDAYATFVAALLNRYPGKIDAVEILNEDSTISWPDTKWRDANYYIPLLTKAYSTVKAINSSIIVTTSALWASPVGYLEDLYMLGAKDYFDVVNFHYYPGKNSPATAYNWLISHYRKVMEKYNDTAKPMWLTEFGWGIDSEGWDYKTIVSPQEQSDYMRYVLDSSMKSGFIDKVFWYEHHGDGGSTLIHTTNYFYWNTYQPTLVSSIGQEDTSLTVSKTTQTASGSIRTINWTIAWPRNGVLIVENEKMKYSSTALTADGDTAVLGLERGIDGTAATSHPAGVRANNQDQTANFRRQIYYTYKNFIQANPTWDTSNIAPLPDVPQPASAPIAVSNAGFESSKTAWLQPNNFDIDNLEYYSGAASARINRASGDGGTKRSAHSALAVEPGRSYFLKAWVKIDPSGDANMNAMVTGDLQDSSGRYLSNMPSNYYIHKTNGNWREIHYPFRTTAETAQLVLYISTSFSSMEHGAATAWFDDITIEPYSLS